MKRSPECADAPPHRGTYVTVEDVDATARKAEALGAKTLVPPTDIPKVGPASEFHLTAPGTSARRAFAIAPCAG